jgi:predicted transcriptional regulator
MNMARKKIPTNLALDPEILARIDAWIKAQEAPYTKTWIFEKALEEFLEKRDG